jgi:pyruvate,water dikinase
MSARRHRIVIAREIPANVILNGEFAGIFEGLSIGSNDLTQFTHGLDRDSALVAPSSANATPPSCA